MSNQEPLTSPDLPPDPNQFKLIVTLPDGTPHTMYESNPKQTQFHLDPTPNLIAIGSRGSGKSLALRMDAHMRALSIPNCNLILIRNTFKDLEKSHLIYLPQEMKLLGGSYHATSHIAYYPNGSRLFFSYVGSEKDSFNLMSAEFIGAYFDELSLIPWEYFRLLCASIRTTKEMTSKGIYPVIRAATNPLGQSASTVQHYFVYKDVDPEDDENYFPASWGSIQINMEDNPHLDIKEYKKQFAGLPDHIRKAWLEGEFQEENALFDFKPSKNGKPYHVIFDCDIKELVSKGQIYCAFDMGYFPDPAYCIWIAHLGSRYVAFHEKAWFRKIASEIAQDIKDENLKLGIKRTTMTFCDPSIDIHTGADVRTIKDTFEMNGVPMENSINNREMFAHAIHSALAEEALPGVPRLQIYNGGKYAGCPYLIKTLPMQKYDPKHPLKLANHKDDHPCCSLAYFLISSGSMERKGMTPAEAKKPWMLPKKHEKWVLGRENVRGI